tara:strand:- start:1161 stop:1835 length:675 start_codon:yes stop_codon:yes gene_type:complete
MIEEIIKEGKAPNTSHQDTFALQLIGKSGFFLDLGCRDPIDGNNSYLLEYYGWKGLLFDVNNNSIEKCKKIRSNPSFCIDVNSSKFLEVLNEFLPKNNIVDFISLDIDGPLGRGIPLVLSNLLNTIEFKCMTYEHDLYAHIVHNKECLNRKESREILTKFGYFNLFPDVKWSLSEDRDTRFEDWWINPKFFPKELIDIKKQTQTSWDIINTIKQKNEKFNISSY